MNEFMGESLTNIEPTLVAILGSLVATVVVVLGAIGSYVYHTRRAQELSKRRADYDRLEARLPEACRLDDLTSRVRDVDQQYQEIRKRFQDARTVIDKKEAASASLERLQEEIQQAQEEHAEKTGKLAALAQRVAEQQEASSSGREELNQLREKITAKEEELHGLGAEKSKLTGAVVSLREQEEALMRANETAVDRLELAKKESRDAERRRDETEAKLATVDRKLAKRKEECLAAQEEVVKRRTMLEKQQDDLLAAKMEQKEVEAATDALRAERDSLTDSIATLRASYERTLEDLRRTGHLRENVEKDLWDPVLKRIRGRDRGRDEVECLERVQSHLEDQGLYFSERTLKAFHTSLKIAEMSPLVVLAGLSGTGKSELPRRYAEAMGMHFLPIPVQPRWDSPQDLFGFFNYLESRYRPTELTRALVQMDPFHEEPERGWVKPEGWNESLTDQMLLVLLDEMNLARVEYYFSEFLSKLETRRGVRKEESIQRRKGEIALEVGRRDDEAAIMRLFVDTNVLFVGTMNEDETTQTLSDKVVDRANVLRFGKPSVLKKRSIGYGRFASDCAVQETTWRGWLRTDRDVDDGFSDLVDEWIQRLNSAMQSIGRPFAHRMHQAIRSYVANYPDQGDDGIRSAMADQIEQRILPRFRGVDPGEPAVSGALDDVLRLIDELDDTELRQSISGARRHREHQFNWQGVDRLVQEMV